MKTSVITATSRKGYLPQIARALANQTMPPTDFEWIIVDDHFEKQRQIISGLLPESRPACQIIHEPPDGLAEFYAPAAARNVGIRRATGELIYYSNEYMLPCPETLARHWELYQEHGEKTLLSGRIIEPNPHCKITLSLDRVKIDDGWRPDFGLTSANHIHPESRHREHACRPIESRPQEPGGTTLYEIKDMRWWWAGRNDSIPRSIVDAVCAFHVEHSMHTWKGAGPENEAFDGGYGYPDQQLAEEAHQICGCRYLFDTLAPAMEIPHARGLGKPMIRTLTEQQALASQFAKERDNLLNVNVR